MADPDLQGKIFVGKGDKPEMLTLAFGNRHGLFNAYIGDDAADEFFHGPPLGLRCKNILRTRHPGRQDAAHKRPQLLQTHNARVI